MNKLFEDKIVLITGGTGSLGTAITRRLLDEHKPRQIIIFSRDELKQANMKTAFNDPRLDFKIGDIRSYHSVATVVSRADIIINTAALKRVEVCDANVEEAINTNIMGAVNIVQAIREIRIPVQTVVNIGSDKGAKPLNVYGMSKGLQEALLLAANLQCPWTRFVGVRYGNVMGSRGSVIPLWLEQIKNGERIKVSDPRMTRFLISLDQAVDTIFSAIDTAQSGEVYIPIIPAALLEDMAKAFSNGIGYKIIGKGIGEKMHEILVTEEEAERTTTNGKYFIITKSYQKDPALKGEYISHNHVVSYDVVSDLFVKQGFIKKAPAPVFNL